MVRFASVNDDGFSLIVGELSDMVRFVRAKVEYKGTEPRLSREPTAVHQDDGTMMLM